jgi:hypothetical protein
METPRTNLLVTDDRVYEYLATERAVRDWVAEVLDVRLKGLSLWRCDLFLRHSWFYSQFMSSVEDLSELKSGVVLLYLMRKVRSRP